MARIINTADLIQGALLPPNDAYWIYNGLDCCVTTEILDAIKPQLDNVSSATYNFSQSLQAPVLEMTMRGILVNQNRKHKVIYQFKKDMARLEEQLDSLVTEGIGVKLNWRSPKQLGELLYDVMKLPEQKKRNSNGIMARTTNRDALEHLTSYFMAEPLILHLLLLRDIGKSVSFLETGIDPDGRMRSNFNIAGTNTGRFASSASDYGTGTNLQNVARLLRSVFVADPGYKFANLDLEQADSRNLGALCWDTFVNSMGEREAGKYLDACESGDLHTFVCKMCNPQLPWDRGATDRAVADTLFYRDKTYRDGSKVLGHGSNYLGQPVTMAKHTKFPTNLVKDFQRQYFGAFPVIPEYHKNVQWHLDNFGSLTTLFGRRRYFFGRKNDPATLREAVAYSPQSMTGDEINTGILRIWRGDRVQLLVQVHDSILFQYKAEEEDEIVPWALEALKAPIQLARGRDFVVPTEAKTGWNWGDISKDNPDGLKKYKGHDDRVRTETNTKLSISGW